MRITIDMINEAEQSINPISKNTISLRGYSISVIENLGVTKDYFECIDLSDNEIIKLNNLPYLQRLRTLILCNNKIARIDNDIFENTPNLNSLVLTNNKLEKLTDLNSIFKAKKLTRLSLLENAVSKLENYREYLIYNIPSLNYLDFHKIKKKDREMAAEVMKIFNPNNKVNIQVN